MGSIVLGWALYKLQLPQFLYQKRLLPVVVLIMIVIRLIEEWFKKKTQKPLNEVLNIGVIVIFLGMAFSLLYYGQILFTKMMK